MIRKKSLIPKGAIIFFTTFFFFPLSAITPFEQWMGKGTKHWAHVQQPVDLHFLDLTQTLYEKNEKRQWIKEGEFKVPPVIHFIWLGPSPFPPESVENVRTWMAHHPEWKIEFWTDRDRDPPCSGMTQRLVKDFHFTTLKTPYEESQNWGEKSDILRYEILYQEGGVYADHDANCLQPFDGIHRGYEFFCCLETPHEPFVGRNITCGNGVIGSRPYHPTIGKVLELIHDRWDRIGQRFRGKDDYSRVEVVMQRTYIALSDAILNTIDAFKESEIVFPAAYFFAKSGISSLYSQHFYATAWDSSRIKASENEKKEEKLLGKIYQQHRRITLMIFGLIVVQLGLLIFFAKGWDKKIV